MVNLGIIREVFKSRNGTNIIYDATYLGQPCYAIQHVPTGHIEVIDHNEQIIKAIIGRIARSTALVCDKRENKYTLKFHSANRERTITLRFFVYAKYKGLSLSRVRGKNICTEDDSTVKDNLLDLRSCNLYDAGEIRPHTKARDIEIVKRPGRDAEYIAISFPDRENGKIEYTEYSPELYEMLARPALCSLTFNPYGDRAVVNVHYASCKKGYIRDNLSKFILIYNLHFGQYKNMSGGVKRFIHDYYKLSRIKYKGTDAAHINACKWNNCIRNLMFMEKKKEHKPNSDMSDYIKWFMGQYRAYTTINDNNEILIEIPDRGYFKCATPDDYADWQKVYLGRAVTAKLQVATYITKDGARQELTPSGMVKAGIANKDSVRDNEPEIWEWLEHSDKLCAMDGKIFAPWKAGMGRTIKAYMPDEMKNGESVCTMGVTSFGCAYMKITKVREKKSRNK